MPIGDETKKRRAAEAAVRAALAAKDRAAAARAVTDAYGAEIYGFVAAVVDDAGEARDVYAAFGEALARELPDFGFACPLRAFAYFLARRVIPAAPATLSTPPASIYRRRGQRGPAVLRRALSREERELLVLRVDRRFTFRELAITSLGPGAAPARISVEIDHMRSRFAGIKLKLTRRAAAHGLL